MKRATPAPQYTARFPHVVPPPIVIPRRRRRWTDSELAVAAFCGGLWSTFCMVAGGVIALLVR